MSTPQHHPSPRELDDLELLTTGAVHPLTAFNAPGSVLTLDLPEDLAVADEVELVDPEGLPLAVVVPATGEVTALTHAQYGPFRRLYLSAKQVREQHAGRTVVPVTDALTATQLEGVRGLGPSLLLVFAGHGTSALSPVALIRATLAAADLLDDAVVVVVPVADHGDADADHQLGVRVAQTYAGTDPVHALSDSSVVDAGGGPSVVEVRAERASKSPYPPTIQAIVDRDLPEPGKQGLVLFFTGLSGSGKSTLARAIMDRVLEQGERTVTSLDGDVVRRHLSAGLGFSREDRETNITRIGWVAAEIARHGGVAICSPIAPFASTRATVRDMVEEAGGEFFLVHVATPLEECERRDRKGLYAKARRGEIPDFTGISSPYEEPDDAAVRVDTTGRTIEDALDDVLEALAETGHLSLRERGHDQGAAASPSVVEVRAERASKPPIRVLFVCTANICRSAWLEQAARAMGAHGIEFSSAGTHGFDAHPMDAVMSSTLDAADEGFRSRRLTREIVEQVDLVLTAESSHRAFVLEEHPQALRKVFTLGQFARAAQAAPDLRGRELLAAAGERRTAPVPDDDIDDPYRRGNAAAEAAAGKMSTMLSVIVEALAEED
ncbi:adenylylsulfate kinase [Nocardioides sp. Soil777]|uniref:adenylyl-sulfate kinase n=1 Tax=Nocardioides sp. Soil777 TaxID=1736409 RepID=UPI0007024171|nr:adenylyl-sulfate kinase [Nocardioides sp. Soil777]KRF02649.1 adenylylsulfate kinase [Nocardioides sp. Soil777]